MNELEKKVVKALQEEFPICEKPFEEIGKRFGISEKEVVEILKKGLDSGIIRHFGASVNTRKLGYYTCLCATSIPEDRLDMVEEIASHPQITHAYLRDHHLNFWFATLTPSKEDFENFVKHLEHKYQIKILSFPTKKKFKVKAVFNI